MHYIQMAHANSTNAIQNYCTTCDSLKYEIAENGICKCKPEYGLQEGNCVPCTEVNCYDCLDDFQFCILCKPGQNRIVENQQCVCQPGSYDPQNEDQICLACDYSCLNCFGPSNVECTKCLDEDISNRILVYNSCQCKIGYADFQLQESKCGKCHPRCVTCSQAADETTNQYCLTCIPGENRVVSAQLKCECQENYGDNFGTKEVCFICDYTCGSCDDAGPTHCVECLEKSGRYLTASGECLCKTSYFDDQTQNIECSKCHYSCLLCQNSAQSNACLQCPLTREPSDPLATTFECNCASLNSFDDGVSPNCPSCDYTCQTCNGPLSSNCLTCDSTYRQLDLSTCVCLIGYYDIGQLECAKCHYSCYQCFDSTIEGCISCSMDLHFRLLKGNICKCIDGYYDELGNAKCKKCSYKCATCETQSDKCLDCPLNSLRTLDPIKGCFCQGEYYEKENEIACQKCHFKCKACDGQNQNNCVSCDSVANRELKINECKCQPHYFETEVQECAVCSSFCYECINNFDNCTSCANDRYLVGSTCRCITKFDGSEISTFDYNGLVKCQKCHHSCGTCLGIEEGDCLNCIESDHRYQVGNTCVCDEGYFDAGLPVCQKCNYKCKGCLKQIESCISCPDNSFRQFVSGFNRCQCIERYYDDGQNEICQKCHYSCLRCNDIETKCELCSIQSDRIYNDQLFSCDCNIGYYDIGIEKCQKCHYSCLSCNSGDANSCDSCLAMNDSNRVFYINTCKCLFGYFDDGQSPQCQKCDIQCLSCIDHSYQCQSCPQTRKIEANCKCQLGYYDVGLQLCSKCSSKCQTCEISPNNCTSCNSIEFRELNLITQTCDCSIGYLEINGICEQCYQSCKTCIQSINKCNSCVQFRILKNDDCICNDGMYESNSDKQCKLCNKTCLTCANLSNYCLTCSTDNFRYFKSGNTCDCMIGYFENSINQNCEKCASSCLTCSLQYDNCLTCDSNLNLSLVNNKCLCSQSYFFDSMSNSCQQCHFSCLECNNNNECTSCLLTTRHLDVDQKKCICHNGYFETNQKNCSQCHLSCETCENSNTYCLSCINQYHRLLVNNTCQCINGYYEAGIELCQKCNNICKTCQSSANSCLSCYEIEHFRYYQGNKCLCQPGYFEQNTEICLKCSTECLTCQGSADYCTSCDTNSKRFDQSFIHKCPCITGFYSDENNICQKCHIKCQTCINQSDQCLSCNYQVNSNRNSLSEQCNCKYGYFDDGTQLQCQQCNFKCKTCVNDKNNCEICQNSIRINPPKCDCMNGYYEDEQSTCQICAPQCDTCLLEPTNCLTCKPGRIEQDCKCIDGFFETGQALCQQCAFQCVTCDFYQLNCKTCKGDRFQEPQCICQSGYFDDQLNENCQKCDSTCLECDINGCLSCFANRILNQDMECIPPPNSIWYDDTPWCSTCQVAVIKVYLSDDISKIIIHFEFPLNPKGFNSQIEINKCLQLFEVETVLKFGQNSDCYINQKNNQELLISVGEYSKLKIGEEILFKSNSISHINCETTIEKFIFSILKMPINPLPPLIEYNVPHHKLNPFADNSVYLKSIKNNGNRKLDNIIWSCQVKASENSSTLREFLDQINFVQEYNLFIPKNTLPAGAEIQFKIQYDNFILISSYSEFIIYTHIGDLPQININVKPSYFVYETIIIGISAGNLDQQISKDNYKYQIQLFEIDRFPLKSSSSQLNISVQSNSFEQINANIQQYTLSPNSTYTFQVIATNLQTQKFQQQDFTINIPFGGLICQFNNGGIQNIRQDLNLLIYCKDLDTKYDWNDDLDLLINVDCRDLSLNSTCQTGQKQIIKVNTTDTYQFIKRNTISSYSVQEWTVKVTKFQQTQKFVLIIVYLDNDFPVLELEFNKGYLMRKINNFEQLNFTFLIPFDQKPQLLEFSIAIIYNYELIKIHQPKYVSYQFKIFDSIKELNFGDTINLKFLAQYTNSIMPSLYNLKLSINQPPQCSKLFVTRSSDLALTEINVTTTCEQSNDFPYRYQLKLFLRETDLTGFLQGQLDNSLTFHSFQDKNVFSLQIPQSVDSSTVGVLIQVLDSGGSISQIFERITSQPGNINCSQSQYQNNNLQYIVSLLFEAMNQNCSQLYQKIYRDLLYGQILQDSNDNNLKFQAIKLYNQFQQAKIKPKNRLLNEENPLICYDVNTTHYYVTQKSSEIQTNLSQKIIDFQNNIVNLNRTLKYLIQIKKECEDELLRNQYIWNEEIFQQLQYSQDSLLNLLYFLDDIYSDFSKINTKNETIYQIIFDLLNYIPKIVSEIQNTILVNDKPVVVQGDEILWQIKRRTKSDFNKIFQIEATQEDYLLDFIQFEQTSLVSNPLRFTSDLDNQLQQVFNDQTLKIYSQNYNQIKLQNFYKNRFLQFDSFPSTYSTKFGTYQLCLNDTQIIKVYEMQCVLRTISGDFHKCKLNRILKNDTMEQNCECNKFGEIFLTTSYNLSKVIVNDTFEQKQQFDNFYLSQYFLLLLICVSSLILIQLVIYIFYLIKDCKNQQKNSVQSKIDPQINLDKQTLIYIGNSAVFKQKFKQIHQTISFLYYRDQHIQLSYRILEVLSQFNILLCLTIIECYDQINQILIICVLIVANPIIILILRIIYKIVEAIYRFGKIAAAISNFILIILLMAPNVVLLIFYQQKIQIQLGQYQVAIIFFGNIVIWQLLIEPITVFARIIVYRLIASSLKNMEMNSIYHLMHFFVMHSSLEEIFEEFTKI
ncbi:unnamed protein product [Paramecium primaurelia]|uniref:EGF-like domain-containing protein n=1 Tax=Paramecium primaurelia TaxID=5886 RepID=A0A8S1N7L0_PARPR|nr:unnamed protein product [Paramecium primaurelia]